MPLDGKPLGEICRDIGVGREIFLEFIRREWVHPPADALNELWRAEDAARARFILELQRDFGVNNEAIPVILHLLDQLHAVRALIRDLASRSAA